MVLPVVSSMVGMVFISVVQVCVRNPGVQVSTSICCMTGWVTWNDWMNTDTNGAAMKSSIMNTDGATNQKNVLNFMLQSFLRQRRPHGPRSANR